MATTLPMPPLSRAVADDAKASSAFASSMADWQAFNTTAGTACSCSRELKSAADFASGPPSAFSKTRQPWRPLNLSGGDSPATLP